jgi:hypothetical protein
LVATNHSLRHYVNDVDIVDLWYQHGINCHEYVWQNVEICLLVRHDVQMENAVNVLRTMSRIVRRWEDAIIRRSTSYLKEEQTETLTWESSGTCMQHNANLVHHIGASDINLRSCRDQNIVRQTRLSDKRCMLTWITMLVEQLPTYVDSESKSIPFACQQYVQDFIAIT